MKINDLATQEYFPFLANKYKSAFFTVGLNLLRHGLIFFLLIAYFVKVFFQFYGKEALCLNV